MTATVVCLVSLALCLGEGWLRADAKMDFFGYFAPSRLWLDGGNPYDRAAFTAGVAKLFPSLPVRDTECALLPSALTVLAPLALLSPDTAARAMWLLSFAALVFSLVAMMRLWGPGWTVTEQLVVIAALAQSRLIQSVAYRGQPSLLMLAAVLAALLAVRRGAPVLAGVAAALATTKFTLVLPLLAFWLWERRWRPLLWTAVVSLVLSLPALVTLGPRTVAQGWLDSAWSMADHNRPAAGDHHIVSIGAVVASLPVAPSGAVAIAVTALPLVAAATGLGWRRTRPREAWMFVALTAFGLVAIYHRVYDAVMLLPAVALVYDRLRTPGGRRDVPTLVVSAALALLVFVLSPQAVAARVASWLAEHPPAHLFAPVNAWLCLVVLAAIIAVVRRPESGGSRA